MLKNTLRKQNGFTLVEILAAMVITAVLFTAVVSFYRTSIFINSNIVNQANAVNQLKNTFNYVSRDAQMAGMVATTSSNFPLTLSWIDYPTTLTTITYTIDSTGILQRNYAGPDGTSTMTIASSVNAAQTNCVWDSTNHYLTVNITISKGSVNESRQFILSPRVIQSSITQTATTVSGNSSPNPSVLGQAVNLNAAVLPSVATGAITFRDGGNTVGIVSVVNGYASYPVSNLSVGSHILTAVYSGDANYVQSTSSAWTQTVNKVTPTVSLSSSSNPSTYHQSVTFTATLNPSAATGTVQFTIDGVNFGTPVSLTGGSATSGATTMLTLGSHSITAVYSGDANDNGSTSSPLTQTVVKCTTITSLTSSSPGNTSLFGQSVTFTADVSVVSPGAGTPTGTVQFKIDGVNFGSPVSLSSGSATSGATTTMAVGSRSITAVYSGDANDNASTGSLTQIVNTSSMVTLTSTITSTSAVTFTATVSPAGPPVPTGTVQFMVNGANLGSAVTLNPSRQATSSSITPTATAQTITAVYSGDINYLTSTSINYYLAKFSPNADTYLNTSSKSLNYGTSTTMIVKVNKSNNILISFTLSSLSGKTIDSADLWMYRSSGNNISVTPNLVTRSWTETGATWNTYNGVNSWTTLGGDYNTPGTAITTASGWNHWTVTSDVTAFITGNNYGWLLNCITTSGSNSSTFYSKEYATTSSRPQLIIVWH